MGSRPLDRARIVVDCRWLGRGGVGTLTDRLLQGLAQVRPEGTWVLWGDAAAIGRYGWDGAVVVDDRRDPGGWGGQRGGWNRPTGDLFCALHQVRPILLRQPVLQVFHDTIPLRTSRSRATVAAKRAYFRAVARTSRRILTVSEFSARQVAADLHVRPERIGVIHYPVDEGLQRRVGPRRPRAASPFLLCPAGRAAPHKNLPRLFDAFSGSRFAADGGRLVVLGGGDTEPAGDRPAGIDVRPWVPQSELDALFAEATAVICPSVEEGFGFPVWDARCLGIPVAASTGGALPEVAGDHAVLFAPEDTAAVRAAIDRVTGPGCIAGPVPLGPSTRDFAEEFLAEVRGVRR